jgi:hypothetical protein
MVYPNTINTFYPPLPFRYSIEVPEAEPYIIIFVTTADAWQSGPYR